MAAQLGYAPIVRVLVADEGVEEVLASADALWHTGEKTEPGKGSGSSITESREDARARTRGDTHTNTEHRK